MTTEEVTAKIKDATEVNWFNTKSNTIQFAYQKYKPEIISVISLHKFLKEQVEGWDQLDVNFNNNLNNSRNIFNSAIEQVEYFINNFQNLEEDYLTNHWNSHVQPNLNQLNNCFCFDSPETQFLYKIYTEFPTYFQGALQFINGNTGSITTKDIFVGAIMAYEFSLNDKSTITKRSITETESLNAIKSNFQKNIDASNAQLANHLQQIDEKYKTYTNEVDEYKTAKETEVNTWFDVTKDGFNTFDTEAKNKIEKLEKTYQELLSLQAPADYWHKRATELKTEGNKWLCYLIISVSIGVLILVILLSLIASNKFEDIFSFSGKTIRWSILLVTLVSFIAYAIRTFTKLTFSTFHLSRDAEERKQLTFVYLSLKENNSVTDAERLLILQSLFSRADTGLLKEDSSPTMPSGIDKLMNR